MKYEGTLDIYAEICCDYCNSVIHNHLDCPVCNKHYAASQQYMELYAWEDGDVIEIECECGAKFQTTDNNPYGDAIWKQV